MPIYEYRCSSCGHELEALQKISESPLSRCPSCGQEALVKLVSAAGFQLKGSGWYVTDFKSGAKKSEAKKDGDGKATEKSEGSGEKAGDAAAAKSGSPSSSSESKSETKSDAGTGGGKSSATAESS